MTNILIVKYFETNFFKYDILLFYDGARTEHSKTFTPVK